MVWDGRDVEGGIVPNAIEQSEANAVRERDGERCRGVMGHADGIEELELPILELGSIATMELLQKSSGLQEFGN